MNEEMKRVSPFWEEKFGSQVDCMYYEDRLLAIDRTLQECDEILEDVGLGTGFISKRSELEYLFDDKRTLWKYVLALPDFMSYYLDEPFYKALNQHATETISLIKPEDFSVNAGEDNQIGITESYYDPYFGEYKETKTKTTFRFADFLGTGYSEAANNDGWIVTKSGYVEEFAQIFEAQYQGMREIAAEEFEKRGITDYETYIDSFSHQGEFDHRMDKPFLSFVSAVLDITIVKPMIEACIEKDLITGEDLSDLECQFKLVFAAVDMATLGGAIGATRLSEMGMKEALKATGKMVAVEFMGNTAVCGIGAIGQAFDWPAPITIMLSLATGITVSCIGNKLLFKNAEGVVIRETELSDAQVNKIGEMLEGESGNNLLDDTGEFVDDMLENNYQVYIKRKMSKGQTPKGRLEWKQASEYWTKESPVARGNNFNKTVREADIYDYHEIYLENGKRLDSYDPDAGEIISRKATDLDKISDDTYRRYLSEFSSKYPKGTKIRSNAYPELDGQALRGQYILEIPASNANLSNIDYYKKIASEYDVILRFTEEVQ